MQNKLAANQVETPSHILKVSSTVQIIEKDLEATITRYLEGCYFADSSDGFIDFWTDNPDFQFTLVATKNGELIDARGLIYGVLTQIKSQRVCSSVQVKSKNLKKPLLKIVRNSTLFEKNTNKSKTSKAAAEVESLREALGELNKVSAAYDSMGAHKKKRLSAR